MENREYYFSKTEWEPKVGYSRAIRVGPHIHVSGTTATDENGNIIGIGDPEKQTRQIFENIKKALFHYGTDLSSVIRTRMYVVDINDWEIIGKVHGEYFKDIRPATALVEVSNLIESDMLVEIEVEAYLPVELR